MTPRDRYLSALYLEEPDRVPVADIEILPELVKKILTCEKQITGDLMNRPDDSLRLFIRAYLKVGMDAIPAYYTYVEAPKIFIKEKRLDVVVAGVFDRYEIARPPDGTSDKGGAWKIIGQVKTMEDFEKLREKMPKVDATAQIKVIQKETKDVDMPICGTIFGGYLFTCVLMGLEEVMVSPYKNPSLLKKMIDYLADWQTEIGLEMIDAGADSIMIGEDFADSHGIFMSPRHFREFILPALKRQTQTLKKKGVPVILHHCGNISPVLEDIVNETGADGLQPLQPEAINIADVKRRVGDKVCLWGNISINTLSLGSPEDVAKEVKERMKDCAPGGGYILGSSHSLIDSVKAENLYAMIKTAHKYGKYA